jgi:hypothetical protein
VGFRKRWNTLKFLSGLKGKQAFLLKSTLVFWAEGKVKGAIVLEINFWNWGLKFQFIEGNIFM